MTTFSGKNLQSSKKSSTFAPKMKYRTVIIGLGTIAHYHVTGIQQSERFDLCAVCDLREETAGNPLWCNLPFYRDYNQMLDAVRPDVAIITTPPAAHYEIAKTCAEHGALPFVEKPLASTKRESKLFFSQSMRGKFVPICHTLYGPEMLWFMENMQLSTISSIKMQLSDPYLNHCMRIIPRYRPLGGCWLDSAPNALAPLLHLVPKLENVSLQHVYDDICGLPASSLLMATYKETVVKILTHWSEELNSKSTEIEADDKHILIDHSLQMVKINDQVVFQADGDRLANQYANFYRLYPNLVPNEKMLKEMYRIIWIND